MSPLPLLPTSVVGSHGKPGWWFTLVRAHEAGDAGPGDLDRLRAVHDNAPNARLIIDANEAWTAATYAELAPELKPLGVELIEQPLPADADDALRATPAPTRPCSIEPDGVLAWIPTARPRPNADGPDGRGRAVGIQASRLRGPSLRSG